MTPHKQGLERGTVRKRKPMAAAGAGLTTSQEFLDKIPCPSGDEIIRGTITYSQVWQVSCRPHRLLPWGRKEITLAETPANCIGYNTVKVL